MLFLTDINGVNTMSSLEMVAYINAARVQFEGVAGLRHDDFMRKVPKVLGLEPSPKFYGYASAAIGSGAFRQQRIYNFPKREAMLMAMSYSYELQAKVFDAWEAAEARNAAPPVAMLPASYLDALKQLVCSRQRVFLLGCFF